MALTNYEKAKALGPLATSQAVDVINKRLDEIEAIIEQHEKQLKELLLITGAADEILKEVDEE